MFQNLGWLKAVLYISLDKYVCVHTHMDKILLKNLKGFIKIISGYINIYKTTTTISYQKYINML